MGRAQTHRKGANAAVKKAMENLRKPDAALKRAKGSKKRQAGQEEPEEPEEPDEFEPHELDSPQMYLLLTILALRKAMVKATTSVARTCQVLINLLIAFQLISVPK